jgi:4-amino-4-deoxy-L-arabinose transferase-like glycosyltransferase
MALSGRIFGFSSWSMLAPQALEGVAAVGLLYGAVRRWSGPVAGLLAGAMLAVTPVAVLMFRFNNPDALLTLLLVAGGYCVVRATEKASARWLMLAGVAIGFAFLTKMLQGFLVVPAFGLVYLVAAPTSLGKRLLHLVGSLAALLVSAGWWVAIVELWPASSRPYIGGSQNNSILGLTFGYNGLGRILGGSGNGGGGGGRPGGGGGGGGGNTGFGGATGITRMFGDAFGTQISWLLPAALIALVAGLWLTRRAPRTDRTRAAVILWGGWLLVTALVFSYMQGTVHPYYSVALAPSIAGLIAVSGRALWQHRDTWFARGALASMVAATGIWSYQLLNRTPTWHPELRYIVLVVAVAVAVGLLVQPRLLGTAATLVAAVAVLVGFGAPAAYAFNTAGTAHTGSIPTAGPSGGGFGGGFGGGGRSGSAGGPEGGGMFGGGPGGTGTGTGTGTGGLPTEAQQGATQSFGGGGGPGGEGASTNSALVALLKATNSTWAAATTGSNSAAPLQLASGRPIMAIGGFSGSDPAPTLAQFKQWVSEGKVHYFVGGGNGGGGGGFGGGNSDISTWVQQNYTATTVGGSTVYDLTK